MSKAFTLIELMIVIVIIGIISLIAMPGISRWYTGFQEKSVADNIVNTLVTARMKAISSNKNQIVVFNTQNNTYYTINDKDNDCVTLQQVANNSCVQAGEQGPINTMPSTIQFGYVPTSNIVPAQFSSIMPSPSACTFCSGNIGAIEFNSAGKAFDMSNPGAQGGAIVVIPSKDLANNDPSREIIIGFISMTGLVESFGR
ncbi:MAG: pilus assembly FimT family protein [bacterium]